MILGNSASDSAEQFSKVTSYLDRLREVDPSGMIQLEEVDGQFLRCFIAPGPARNAFGHCRKFVAIDGTATKECFIQTLLLAIAMDAENQLVVLAWAVVPSESEDSWTWFLQRLVEAYPDLNHPPTVIVSDRERGLLTSVESVVPGATHGYCCRHILNNIRSRFGARMENPFWACVYAKVRGQFEEALSNVAETSEGCAEYIDTVEHQAWARYAFPGRRYGMVTSNLVESANSMFGAIRELPILSLLSGIWDHQMAVFYERSLLAEQASHLAPRPLTRFQASLDGSRFLQASPSSRTAGIVFRPGSTERFAVQLPSGTMAGRCSCFEYYEHSLPCAHACALARELGMDPLTLVDEAYTAASYAATYSVPYPPVVLEGLSRDNLAPPTTRRPRGRPVRIRIRSTGEVPYRRRNRCSICGQLGHNRTRCRQPH